MHRLLLLPCVLLGLLLSVGLAACGADDPTPTASTQAKPPPSRALGKPQQELQDGLDALAEDLNALDTQVQQCVSRPDLTGAPSYAQVRSCIRDKWALTAGRVRAFSAGVDELSLSGLACERAQTEFVTNLAASARVIEREQERSATATDRRLQAGAGRVGDAVRAVVVQMDRILVPCGLADSLVE